MKSTKSSSASAALMLLVSKSGNNTSARMERYDWRVKPEVLKFITQMHSTKLFFPTSLCGVLVFDSVSRAPPPPSPPPPSSTLCHHTLVHTHFVTTHFVTTHCQHTLCPHTLCHHTLCHQTLCPHTLCPHLRFMWQAWHKLTSTVVLCGRRGTHGTVWRAWSGFVARGAAPLCVAGVAQPDIQLRFTWQAWHNLTSTFVLRGRRGTDGTGWRAWSGFVARGAAPLCVAGVALGDIHLRFTWQAWHKLTSTVVLRGRRGTHGTVWRAWSGFVARGAAPLCVAGVALGDIHLRFMWQAWHKLTSTVVLCGRRGTHGTVWRAWSGFVARGAASLCVAGVALGDIHLRFTWQTWHKLTSTVVLRGRRGTHGTVWRAWSGFVARGAAPLCVAGVALGDIHLRFMWQAWHKLTSTVVLCGRRGTHGTVWRAWSGFVARGAASLCVAGVALGDIHLRFTWQTWHKLTSTVVLRGRRGTHGTVWRAWSGFVARGAASLCVAGVALGDIHLRFTWQAWHKLTSTVVLRGRRGTHGTVWRAWSGFVARGAAPLCVAGVALGDIHLRFTWQAWHKLTSTVVLRGRRGTSFDTPSFTHHFVTHHLSHTIFHTQLCHPPSFTHHLSHTTLSPTIFDTPSFTHHLCNTPSFTHHLLHPTLSNSIFDTPSFTHRFVTHHFVTPSFTTPSSTHHLSPPHFSHTTLSHTIFDTPSFTQHFATHRLSHTTLSHALFHTGLSPTPSFSTPSFTHHFVTHHLSPHHPSHTTLSHTDHLSPHHLSHTTLSHTIFHTQLCHTLSFTHNFHTRHLSHTAVSHTHTHTPSFTFHFVTHNCFNFSILHRLLSPNLLSPSLLQPFMLIIGRS